MIIKVLHRMFKEKYPEYKIGSTKFAELRPKWCVIAGSSGTHGVCVCTKHQNVKTMIDAINLKTLTKGSEIELNDYKDCISYILCRKSTTDCFLLNCRKCPKMKEFSELFTGLLQKNKIEQIIFSMSFHRPFAATVHLMQEKVIPVIKKNYVQKERKFITHPMALNNITKIGLK